MIGEQVSPGSHQQFLTDSRAPSFEESPQRIQTTHVRLDSLQQQASLVGDLDLSAPATQQLGLQLALQRSYLLPNRRRGQAQRFGRRSKAPFARRQAKTAELG